MDAAAAAGGGARRSHASEPTRGRRLAARAGPCAGLVLLSRVVAATVVIEAATAAGQGGLGSDRRRAPAPARRRRPRACAGAGHGVRRGARAPARQPALESFIGEVYEQGLAAVRALPVEGPVRRPLRARRRHASRPSRRSCESDGLQVGAATGDGLLVRFSGPAAQCGARVSRRVSSATGWRTAGSRARATSAPALPAPLAGSVATVVGLDESRAPAPAARAPEGLAAPALRERQGGQAPASAGLAARPAAPRSVDAARRAA